MPRLRRLVLTTSLALIAGALALPNAHAVSQGEHYTYGSTAYGVRADLTIRRPGLPAGQIYDNKIWASSGFAPAFRGYAGYRSWPGGTVAYITQTGDTFAGITTTQHGSTSAQSNTTFNTSIRVSNWGSTFNLISLPSGVYGRYIAPSYDEVSARSYMTDGSIHLSGTDFHNLNWYRFPDAFATNGWGFPTAHATWVTPVLG